MSAEPQDVSLILVIEATKRPLKSPGIFALSRNVERTLTDRVNNLVQTKSSPNSPFAEGAIGIPIVFCGSYIVKRRPTEDIVEFCFVDCFANPSAHRT